MSYNRQVYAHTHTERVQTHVCAVCVVCQISFQAKALGYGVSMYSRSRLHAKQTDRGYARKRYSSMRPVRAYIQPLPCSLPCIFLFVLQQVKLKCAWYCYNWIMIYFSRSSEWQYFEDSSWWPYQGELSIVDVSNNIKYQYLFSTPKFLIVSTTNTY